MGAAARYSACGRGAAASRGAAGRSSERERERGVFVEK
jgi:hypothetical protein